MRERRAALAATVLALSAAGPAAPAPRFRDAAADWGIEFRHHHGGRGDFFMIETMGSGVVIFDSDGDGDQDVFFVDSGELPRAGVSASRPALYRNDGRGAFVERGEEAGVRLGGYGMGATAGDVDADGDLDLYLTAYGPGRLLVNRGDGTFADGTAAGGLDAPSAVAPGEAPLPEWGSSAAFADPDRDGDLDLYVTHYLDFTFADNPLCGKKELKLRSYCHPDVYGGLPDRYFRNDGRGAFADATSEAGFAAAGGKGLGVVFADVDGDLWPDLYVANDMTPNFLFRNRADGTFEEIGVLAGAALSDIGEVEAGMGVDAADIDGNGLPDVVVTNLDLQTNALYGNLGGAVFVERRYVAGIAQRDHRLVGFGVAFADFDQDGDLDLAIANGHIIHNIDEWGTGTTYKQRNQLFVNDGAGRLQEVEETGMGVVRSSRGLAAGDLDGDGDLDLAINNSNDLAEVYENVTEAAGRWLAVDLERAGGAEPFGIGARLRLEAGGRRQEREVRTASSYQSQSQITTHFGLGGAAAAVLEVAWPDGRIQRFNGLPADRRVRIVRAR